MKNNSSDSNNIKLDFEKRITTIEDKYNKVNIENEDNVKNNKNFLNKI